MNENTKMEKSDTNELSDNNLKLKKKLKKPGIIYLNYIPRYMSVKKVREIFSDFGEVRRLFLKPEKSKPGKPSKFFSEGWVEFTKKKIAKQVAECLNGTQVGGKRHSPYYDALWSIKYLPKFQWSNLSQKKAYEKSKKVQRMKAEIAQVKREVNFYSREVEKKQRRKTFKEFPKAVEEEQNRETLLKSTEKDDDSLADSKRTSEERNLLLLKQVFGNL